MTLGHKMNPMLLSNEGLLFETPPSIVEVQDGNLAIIMFTAGEKNKTNNLSIIVTSRSDVLLIYGP